MILCSKSPKYRLLQ